MREILFRGKRLNNGEWVFGDLYHRWEEVVITSFYAGHHVAVDPATVGQFTGLTDKNGERIFEGDVVSTGKEKRVVRFRNGAFELLRRASAVAMYDLVGTDVEYEVIGTIHDKEKQNEGK